MCHVFIAWHLFIVGDNMKKIIVNTGLIFITVVLFYGSLLFILPFVMNSSFMINNYEAFLEKKTGFPVKIEDLNFSVEPNFVYFLKVGKICSENDDNKKVLSVEKMKFSSNIFSPRPIGIVADNVHIDLSQLKSFKQRDKKSKKNGLEFSYFPMLRVNRLYLKIDNENTYIEFLNVKSGKFEDKLYFEFGGRMNSPMFNKTVKINEGSTIYYYGTSLYFDDVSVSPDENSVINISGELGEFFGI